MSEMQTLTAARIPTVYFIDDSATMREVIKIAFRKENIHVITCADAASALTQFGEAAPDLVITDVIMPDKDGYEVCQFIKQHEQLGKTPVILMSGVVNRTVAEKAMAAKADDLIRKPFQPHELIVRVKNLLNPRLADSTAGREGPDSALPPSHVLSGLFSGSSAPPPRAVPPFPRGQSASAGTAGQVPPVSAAQGGAVPSAEMRRLRNEMQRLSLLVKKLQAELEAEHQYCAALEAHLKTLQESD